MKNKDNKFKTISRNLLIIVLVFLFASGILLTGCTENQRVNYGDNNTTDSMYSPNFLVLVNKTHLIPDNYLSTIELINIKNVDGGTYQVEKTTKAAFENLQKDLMRKSVEIGVDSAYRSVEKQIEIKNDFLKKYGEEYTKSVVAEPGTSEHHTGLVIDLVPKINGKWITENEDMIKETEIFRVIHETLSRYGFIVRYPKGKESITGYNYEPWHIRYVGKEVADEMYCRGITLEEYLGVEN